ncbi:MAG: F0F1 ATP synthase subunit gamma, partial [Chloroflexota bacterium]
MPSTRQLRLRIRSVSNTAKITKAMQFIAASKMRRAQEMVMAGRPYSERMNEMLSRLAALERGEEGVGSAVPLLDERPVQRTGMVLITPDRGLCGALVGNINRAAGEYMRDSESPVSVIAVGRKGRDFIVRT